MLTRSESIDLLSVREAAAVMRVRQETILRWINKKVLPANKLGTKLWRIKAADLEALLGGGGHRS